eukprot:3755059-Pleurochrysis_carterae.AAC.2
MVETTAIGLCPLKHRDRAAQPPAPLAVLPKTPLGLCCCDHSRDGSFNRFGVLRELMKRIFPSLDVESEVRPCI